MSGEKEYLHLFMKGINFNISSVSSLSTSYNRNVSSFFPDGDVMMSFRLLLQADVTAARGSLVHFFVTAFYFILFLCVCFVISVASVIRHYKCS